MIKVINGIGKALYINPESIVGITTNIKGETEIQTTNELYFVDDSPEEVAKKVLEYKLTMEDFKACLMNDELVSTAQIEKRLHQLADWRTPND